MIFKERATDPAGSSPPPVRTGNEKSDEHAHCILIVALVSTFALLLLVVILVYTLYRRYRRCGSYQISRARYVSRYLEHVSGAKISCIKQLLSGS